MPAIPPPPTQLIADLVRSDDGNRSRIYMDGWMRRIEVRDHNGQASIIITRPDKGLIWMLSPDTKTYQQSKLPKNFERAFDPYTVCDWTEDGIEIIDGRRCRRFVGRYLSTIGPVGLAHEFVFIDAKTGVHRRTVTYDKNGKLGITCDCLNATVGPPPPSVFEMPKGYKRGYHRRKRS
jgi:hypothetical protein